MPKIIFCILLLAITSFSGGSDSCFKLSEYSPPAFNYHLLELTPDFSFNGETRNSSTKTNYVYRMDTVTVRSDPYSDYSSSKPHLGILARHAYYGWKGSTEWQISSSISGKGSWYSQPGSISDINNNELQVYSSDKGGSGYAQAAFSVSAAHYFWKPFFIGAKISPDISGTYSRGHHIKKRYIGYIWYQPVISDYPAIYDYRDEVATVKNYNIGGYGNIRIGAGHIDDVTFAVAALNMLDRIAVTEKSYKGCNAKHVQKLAGLIEKMRKRRIYDSRIAFIENVDTLCTFIKENDIAGELSTRTALELADQWEYAFHQKRKNGFLVMLYPEADYSRQFNYTVTNASTCSLEVDELYHLKNSDNNDFRTCSLSNGDEEDWHRMQNFDYGLNLLARYERPLSRFYQLSILTQVIAKVNRLWAKESPLNDSGSIRKYRYAAPMITTRESICFAYYPNTRTSVEITEEAEYNRVFDYFDIFRSGFETGVNPPELNYDNRNLRISLYGNVSYYFSPQIQANLNIGIHWSDDYQFSYDQPPWERWQYVSTSSNGLSYSISGGITWKIF